MSVDWKALSEAERNFKTAISEHRFKDAEAYGELIYEQTNLCVDRSYVIYAILLQIITMKGAICACIDICQLALDEKVVRDDAVAVNSDNNGTRRCTYPQLRHFCNFFMGISSNKEFTYEDALVFTVFEYDTKLLKDLFEMYAKQQAVRIDDKKLSIVCKFMATLDRPYCSICNTQYAVGSDYCPKCGNLRQEAENHAESIFLRFRSDNRLNILFASVIAVFIVALITLIISCGGTI